MGLVKIFSNPKKTAELKTVDLPLANAKPLPENSKDKGSKPRFTYIPIKLKKPGKEG